MRSKYIDFQGRLWYNSETIYPYLIPIPMALTFIDQLNRLLADNRTDQALDEIFEAISIYKKEHPDPLDEIEDFESPLILLSARFKETERKRRNIQVSDRELEIANSRVLASRLGMIRLLKNYASIAEPDDFVVARSVSNLTPIGVGDAFDQDQVQAWTRIRAPRPERVSFAWYNEEGQRLAVSPGSVQRSDRYRTYKSHRFAQPGTYEVRLYNSQDALIARRVFTLSF